MRCKAFESLIGTVYMPLCAKELPQPICNFGFCFTFFQLKKHRLWFKVDI